jgi:hypothetical protein
MDETFESLAKAFRDNPKVASHLEQYGPFSVTRADANDVPSQKKLLPFSARKTGSDKKADEASPDDVFRIYVGVDYGRSDVKCAVLDAKGKQLSTYVTRWWRPAASGTDEREYLDPAKLEVISEPLRCLGEAALDVIALAIKADGVAAANAVSITGLGLSAAGCVLDGHLCGLPPAFGGCNPEEAAPVTSRLEQAVLEYVGAHLASKMDASVTVHENCATYLVNDGDASAMWGATGLNEGLTADGSSLPVGLFLSCGTGLAGGIVKQGGENCQGVFEMGKLVMGLRSADSGVAPLHDTLGLEGSAQGMAGTQRSFFNLLAARGGEKIEGKAEQRAAIIAMQKRPLDDEVREIFNTLGNWLAQFVIELSEYLPFKLDHVEAGGKLTDAASGEIMLEVARQRLSTLGVQRVQRADESEFGQAIAMAEGARPSCL